MNLDEALDQGVNIKCIVNPESSKIIQMKCIQKGIDWVINKGVGNLNMDYLFIDDYFYKKHLFCSKKDRDYLLSKCKEYSFEEDQVWMS